MRNQCLRGLSLCLIFTGSALSQAQSPHDALRAFREHLEKFDGYSAEDRQAGETELESQLRNDSGPKQAISSALGAIHKDFAGGLASYQDGKATAAIATLQPFAKAKDPFLSSEARYFLARCFLEKEDHENAYPLLARVKDAPSVRAADMLFLRGICEAKLLKRKEAIESFAEFMRTYPDASERQRVTAWRQLEILALVEEGTLIDAHQKMEYSRRRLANARANKPTQEQQKATIAILDKLIKQAEEREAVSESKSKKESKGKKKSQSKSKGGGAKEGQGGGADDKTPMKTVRKVQQNAERTPWDHVRDKKRDAKALAAIKEKYPARYRALIEQYYRSLQEDKR